ncbi:MAG TPA: hypothetical protein VI306_00120 [Pyrinomonadaceae bacterium]
MPVRMEATTYAPGIACGVDMLQMLGTAEQPPAFLKRKQAAVSYWTPSIFYSGDRGRFSF